MLDKLHEGPLLAAADEEARAHVAASRHHTNEMLGRVLSVASLPFLFLLAWLNLERYAQGKFDALGVAYVLALSHLVMVASIAPGLALHVLKRPMARAVAREAHMVLLTGGALIAGAGVAADRTGFVQLGLALIAANLVYQVPLGRRTAFNIVAATAGAVSLMLPGLAATTRVSGMIELLCMVVICWVAGAMQHRTRVASLLAERQLKLSAMTDALTGVASRRRIEEELGAAIALQTAASPVSMVVVDIDHFKRVNDTHGHNTGDEVLRGVARLIQQRVRLVDIIGRWGGEEFVIVCRKTPAAGAAELSERLRERIADYHFPLAGAQTASFGVAQARPADTVQSLFARADAALYEAKRAGRNRVFVSAEALAPAPAAGGLPSRLHEGGNRVHLFEEGTP